MSQIHLLFPPSWTLTTGSAHLALPLLKGFLESRGISTRTRDLNLEFANQFIARLPLTSLQSACTEGSLEDMNEPYFRAEDEINRVAAGSEGEWNAQLGFAFSRFSHHSSRQVFESLDAESPFNQYFDERVIPDIQKENPPVVGICLASLYQLIPTFQLCKRLRRAGYEGFIVLGGNTVSRLLREISIPPVFDLIDGLIPFQGEIPMLELYRVLREGGDLANVPCLIWQDSDGNIRQNADHSEFIPDDAATPDYRDLPVGEYWGVNYLNVVSARGCYWGKCNFCVIPYGWGHNGFAGQRSARKTYGDIVALMERHGIRRFKFVDETLSPHFMRAFSEQVIDNGLDIEWEGYTRLERDWRDADFVDLVSRAGFRKGWFGLECLPSDKRAHLNKNDAADPMRLLELCNAANIKVHFFCMFGYPGTGKSDAANTVEFLLNNRERIDTVDIFPWVYTKHTHVKRVERIERPDEDWALEYAHASLRADTLNSEEIAELASDWEEVVWAEAPELLHPTYRMVSPWSVK
uniref:Radical SAM superfamily enzyme YgiQ, UPF0313 family n=1 Tax=Candidatus Kentrum sp. DK TaxID=2126562 RepID=A0A450S7S8_9GAMM|nr:MAG: Radical SAM superfamily enzyme YgiQ, UPF0313 family [Candidatus Kentron sp. DK]